MIQVDALAATISEGGSSNGGKWGGSGLALHTRDKKACCIKEMARFSRQVARGKFVPIHHTQKIACCVDRCFVTSTIVDNDSDKNSTRCCIGIRVVVIQHLIPNWINKPSCSLFFYSYLLKLDYLELRFELSLMQFGGEGQGEKWYACVYENGG